MHACHTFWFLMKHGWIGTLVLTATPSNVLLKSFSFDYTTRMLFYVENQVLCIVPDRLIQCFNFAGI